jgi:penicillin-binding protein A
MRALKTAGLLVAAASMALACFLVIPRELARRLSQANEVTGAMIARALDPSLNANRFPPEIELTFGDYSDWARVAYTIDYRLQATTKKLFEAYQPDYGALVALDATTGRILSMVSYAKKPNELGNLSLKATFPAASVFKIVTAAAAIDENKANPDTIFHFNGANHTLYRRNIAALGSRHMTLREAFAKSVNTVFGKLGVSLRPRDLQLYAKKFGFNGIIPSDIPLQPGRFLIDDEDDSWSVAEVASGFNRVSVMSPLQGALMAAAIVNDGVMMEPHLVESLEDQTGTSIYRFQPKIAATAVRVGTAAELRSMMRETVTNGTSRKAFRQLLRKRSYSEYEIGGKTGSLTSISPRGRCEWFVGYALDGEHRIAVAALTVHEKIWKLKASELARLYMENYFRGEAIAVQR